jgi:hypothetical protein
MKKEVKKRGTSSMLGQSRGIVSDYLPWILIAIAVLAIVTIAILLLKEKGISLIELIKDLFGGV